MKQDQDLNANAGQYGQANIAEDIASLATETTGALEEINSVNTSAMEALKKSNEEILATIKEQQKHINLLKNTATPSMRSMSSTSE